MGLKKILRGVARHVPTLLTTLAPLHGTHRDLGRNRLTKLLREIDRVPICLVCGEQVPMNGLRAHLFTHRPDASILDTEELWDHFTVSS